MQSRAVIIQIQCLCFAWCMSSHAQAQTNKTILKKAMLKLDDLKPKLEDREGLPAIPQVQEFSAVTETKKLVICRISDKKNGRDASPMDPQTFSITDQSGYLTFAQKGGSVEQGDPKTSLNINIDNSAVPIRQQPDLPRAR